ncbi:MAG: DNA polymerase Y family protein, partial [Rhizobiales bacterium]|nr:DNA polymerase Y family protein [Hyphomicrobiales bacterium]
MKNYISIFFPHLELNALEHEARDEWAEQICVIVKKIGNKERVFDANKNARRLGITQNQSLSKALACFDALRVYPHNIEFQTKKLRKLARFCLKYSPQIMITNHDRLLLDATGCSHLYGGNDGLLQHIQYDLSELGYNTQIAMANNMRAANAFTHQTKINNYILHQNQQIQRDALLQLPIEYLHIDAETLIQLERVGLVKINQLLPIKSAALLKRYGTVLMQHLNQALGHEAQAFQAIKFSHIYR